MYIENSQLLNAGKGLYTAINIYKDEIIAVFKGEILSEDEIVYRIENENDKYFINMVDGSIMDSMLVNCFAKYANDAEAFSKSSFKNNAKIALDEEDNVCLIAIRNIKSGSEIFCSYGKKYWKKHS